MSCTVYSGLPAGNLYSRGVYSRPVIWSWRKQGNWCHKRQRCVSCDIYFGIGKSQCVPDIFPWRLSTFYKNWGRRVRRHRRRWWVKILHGSRQDPTSPQHPHPHHLLLLPRHLLRRSTLLTKRVGLGVREKERSQISTTLRGSLFPLLSLPSHCRYLSWHPRRKTLKSDPGTWDVREVPTIPWTLMSHFHRREGPPS